MSDDTESPGSSTVGDGSRRGRRDQSQTTKPTTKVPQGQPARVAHAVAALDRGDRYCAARDGLVARFGVTPRTAERDLKLAYEAIAAEHAAELPTIAARLSARIWRLALRCEKRRDEGGALAAYAQIAKLVGLGAAEHRVVVDPITAQERAMLEVLAMTPAQRLQEERELEMQRAESLAATDDEHERTDDAEDQE